MLRNGPEELVREDDVHHRYLVDDHEVGIEGLVESVAEASGGRLELEEPVDRGRLEAGGFREPLRGPAGRRAEAGAHPLRAHDVEHRVDDGGLPDPGAAGDDGDPLADRAGHRFALRARELDAHPLLRPRDRLLRIDVPPRGAAAGEQAAEVARRAALGPLQDGEVDPGVPVAHLVHELVVGELAGERPFDDLRIDLEQLGGGFDEGSPFAGAVPLAGELLEHVADPRPGAGDRVGIEPEGLRNRVGGAEADATHVEGEPVGVLADAVHRLVPVEPVDPDRPGRSHSVRLQEDHDLADRLLLSPCGDHPALALRSDPGKLAEALGVVLDDLEDLRAEHAHELRREVGADAPDHPRAEVLLDAFEGARRDHPQVFRPELEPVPSVVDPGPGRLHELAGTDRHGGPDHGDRLAAPGGVHPQHAETGFLAVEGDPLDGAGDPVRVPEFELQGRLAPPRCASRSLGHGVSLRTPARPAGGGQGGRAGGGRDYRKVFGLRKKPRMRQPFGERASCRLPAGRQMKSPVVATPSSSSNSPSRM